MNNKTANTISIVVEPLNEPFIPLPPRRVGFPSNTRGIIDESPNLDVKKNRYGRRMARRSILFNMVQPIWRSHFNDLPPT